MYEGKDVAIPIDRWHFWTIHRQSFSSLFCLLVVCVLVFLRMFCFATSSIVRPSYDVHTYLPAPLGFVLCFLLFFASSPLRKLCSLSPLFLFLHYLWSTKAVLHTLSSDNRYCVLTTPVPSPRSDSLGFSACRVLVCFFALAFSLVSPSFYSSSV